MSHLVIYYCGHGISENLAWNQFLIPGDYTGIPGTKDIEELGERLVWVGDIADRLNQPGLRYMLLLDCCRKETADQSFPERTMQYFFSDQNVETLKTLVWALKYLNEFHTPNPVVFSIAPGYYAPVVDVPDRPLISSWGLDSNIQVGPICRRTLSALQMMEPGQLMSIKSFVATLIDPAFDPSAPVSVSHYEREEDRLGEEVLLKR